MRFKFQEHAFANHQMVRELFENKNNHFRHVNLQSIECNTLQDFHFTRQKTTQDSPRHTFDSPKLNTQSSKLSPPEDRHTNKNGKMGKIHT